MTESTQLKLKLTLHSNVYWLLNAFPEQKAVEIVVILGVIIFIAVIKLASCSCSQLYLKFKLFSGQFSHKYIEI